MSSTGPRIDSHDGDGAQRPATGLYIDDSRDMNLSVGQGEWVYVDGTTFVIVRDGNFIMIQHQVGGEYHEVIRASVED